MWIAQSALEIAERHRQECEARLAAHRALLARMEAAGRPFLLREARVLLATLERLQRDAAARVAELQREIRRAC